MFRWYQPSVETNRDWGSTMKPISDYAPALDIGIHFSTAATITDAYLQFPSFINTRFYNWDRSFMVALP